MGGGRTYVWCGVEGGEGWHWGVGRGAATGRQQGKRPSGPSTATKGGGRAATFVNLRPLCAPAGGHQQQRRVGGQVSAPPQVVHWPGISGQICMTTDSISPTLNLPPTPANHTDAAEPTSDQPVLEDHRLHHTLQLHPKPATDAELVLQPPTDRCS